jgi:hypothetical protein
MPAQPDVQKGRHRQGARCRLATLPRALHAQLRGDAVTGIDANDENLSFSQRGHSIRHVETWHERDNQSFIHWGAPELTEANLPYWVKATGAGARVGPSRTYHQAVHHIRR